MKVVIEATLEGKVVLPISADVDTFTDLNKLATKLSQFVAGVKKVIPDLAARKVERVRVSTE